jgi:hypothetical protein
MLKNHRHAGSCSADASDDARLPEAEHLPHVSKQKGWIKIRRNQRILRMDMRMEDGEKACMRTGEEGRAVGRWPAVNIAEWLRLSASGIMVACVQNGFVSSQGNALRAFDRGQFSEPRG